MIGLALVLSSTLLAGDFEDGIAAYGQQNYGLAFTKFKLAADQGYASAQDFLGLMYNHGVGVTQNYAEAVKWLKLAADQGIAEAQLNLGGMYHEGLGVTKNEGYATYWLKKAAAQGYAPAQEILKRNGG